jgi:hypothetical protein
MSVGVDFVKWLMQLSGGSYFLEPYLLYFDIQLPFLSRNWYKLSAELLEWLISKCILKESVKITGLLISLGVVVFTMWLFIELSIILGQ